MKGSTGIAVAIIALALGSSLAVWTISSSMGASHTNAAAGIADPAFGAAGPPLILHTVQYAERVINRTLILPNSTVLGSSFKVVGVRINDGPTSGAVATASSWSVTIYLWNGTAVNGTTTISDIVGGTGVAVVENGLPAGQANSSLAAQAMLAPPAPLCVTKAGSTTCQSQTYSGSKSYIVNQNGLSIVANPHGNQLVWVDDRNAVQINIVGGSHSIQEALNLANTMTQPPK